MKKLIVMSLAALFLASCGGSKKGAWSSSDMEECINDAKKEFVGEDVETIEKMFKVDVKNLPSCICKNLEKHYESYEAADKISGKDFSDEESLQFVGDCLGEDFKNLIKALKKMPKEEIPETPAVNEESMETPAVEEEMYEEEMYEDL